MLRACIFPVNRGARTVPKLLPEVGNLSFDIDAFVDEGDRMARQGDFVDEIIRRACPQAACQWERDLGFFAGPGLINTCRPAAGFTVATPALAAISSTKSA